MFPKHYDFFYPIDANIKKIERDEEGNIFYLFARLLLFILHTPILNVKQASGFLDLA